MKTIEQFLQEKGWGKSSRGMFDYNGIKNLLAEYTKDLQHHYDTTLGLYATDKPQLINDLEKVLFEIK